MHEWLLSVCQLNAKYHRVIETKLGNLSLTQFLGVCVCVLGEGGCYWAERLPEYSKKKKKKVESVIWMHCIK